jgi:Ankyrin repeats (3 copies)
MKKVFLALALISPYGLAMEVNPKKQQLNDQLRAAIQAGDMIKIQEALNNGADESIFDNSEDQQIIQIEQPDEAVTDEPVQEKIVHQLDEATEKLFDVLKSNSENSTTVSIITHPELDRYNPHLVLPVLDQVKQAVLAGANVNAVNHLGKSPLHYAIALRKTDIVKYLLVNGALVNTTNEEVESPLYYAVRGLSGINDVESKRIIKILGKAGAKIKNADIKYARQAHFPIVVRWLLEKKSIGKEAANVGFIVRRNDNGDIISSNLGGRGFFPPEIMQEIFNWIWPVKPKFWNGVQK